LRSATSLHGACQSAAGPFDGRFGDRSRPQRGIAAGFAGQFLPPARRIGWTREISARRNLLLTINAYPFMQRRSSARRSSG